MAQISEIYYLYDGTDFMHICSLVIAVQMLEFINFFVIYNWLSNIKKDIVKEFDNKIPSKHKEPDL